MKSIVTGLLLVFVAGSIVFLVVKESRSPAATGEATTRASAATPATKSSDERAGEATAAEPAQKIIVYYFHGTARCRKCLTMEAYARAAVAEEVIPATPEGSVEWRVVNVDLPENAHFVKEFQLTSSAVVVAKMENDGVRGWKNLDRIWDLVADEAAFKDYVTAEALNMLEGGP